MEEIPIFDFPLVTDVNLMNQLATIIEEMLAKWIPQIDNEMEIDHLSSLPDHIIHHILSFMDTKYAVQTSVLSKRWRNQWTHIPNLNLECTETKIANFKKFILHVLHHRNPIRLNGLRFRLHNAKSQALMRIISSYALSRGLKELDTNLTTFSPSFYHCQTLTTLKLGPHSGDQLPDLSTLPLLTTLELTDTLLVDRAFISRCLTLVNLTLINCKVIGFCTLNIPAPQLVNLSLSNLIFVGRQGKIVIRTPRLELFNWSEINPVELSMDDCPTLEKVDIYLSQPCQHARDKTQTYILDMLHMVEGLFNTKVLRISMNFPKEKFILCQNKIDGEAKIVVVDKVTGVQQLVGLATILEEN